MSGKYMKIMLYTPSFSIGNRMSINTPDLPSKKSKAQNISRKNSSGYYTNQRSKTRACDRFLPVEEKSVRSNSTITSYLKTV